MQYPIIDNLIYAYLRNGWTGLTITPGKNVFNVEAFLNDRNVTYTIENGIITLYTVSSLYTDPLIISDVNENFVLSAELIHNVSTNNFRIEILKTNGTLSDQITENGLVAVANGDRVRFNWSSPGTAQIKNVQIEKGTQPTPYEPWVPGHTDIDKRLKLPMIHYFPHPVIDAIISAADGQHTEEEKEILRHYLTPLGIGGI